MLHHRRRHVQNRAQPDQLSYALLARPDPTNAQPAPITLAHRTECNDYSILGVIGCDREGHERFEARSHHCLVDDQRRERAGCDLHQRLAFGSVHQLAGRIVEVWLQISEARSCLADCCVERLEIPARRRQAYRDRLTAVAPNRAQRVMVGRIVDDDSVAGPS